MVVMTTDQNIERGSNTENAFLSHYPIVWEIIVWQHAKLISSRHQKFNSNIKRVSRRTWSYKNMLKSWDRRTMVQVWKAEFKKKSTEFQRQQNLKKNCRSHLYHRTE